MNVPNPEEANIRFLDSIYRTCVARCQGIRDIQSVLGILDNGIAVLDNEIKCDQYIALYGGHHYHKLYAAFNSTNFRYTEGKNIEIIDWGCGQALATCVLIDYLIENRIKPNIISITLIEPSSIALKRGHDLTSQMFQNNLPVNSAIRTVNKYINDLKPSDLTLEQDTIKVHLFSNIIDIESVNLDNLYRLILKSFQGLNRLICTSPDNFRRDRLDNFYNLFSQSCQVYNSTSSNETIYQEVFYFKTRRYEDCRIGRCERQFTVNLR